MTTVVTPTFNSAASVATTLESILGQSRQVERIVVVDGGSRDETASIVKRYLRPQDTFVSERDRGPYDAMNKGVRMATTEVVAILNSDDHWLDGTLESIEETFKVNPAIGIVHGNIEYVMPDADPIEIKPTIGFWRTLGLGLPTAHPAAFIRKRVYDEVGFYDFERFPMTADQDLVYRAFAKNVKDLYVDRILTVMHAGGLSSTHDLSAEIDVLLDSLQEGYRKPAKYVRQLLRRENRFYNGLVSSGFGREIWRRHWLFHRLHRVKRLLKGKAL